MPTDGHIINFRQGLPLVADTRSLTINSDIEHIIHLVKILLQLLKYTVLQ